MKKIILGMGVAAFLSACSSTNTSGLRGANNVAAVPSLNKYNAVVVPDFTDATAKQDVSKQVRSNYARELSLALADTKAFDVVQRDDSNLDGKTVLSVQGEIDKVSESDNIGRYLALYTDGETRLNATINFVDFASGAVLGSMEISRKSSGLGGIFAVNESVDKFMTDTAVEIAEEVADAKKN